MTPEEIKDLRIRLGLTQVALANKLHASVESIRNWELGRRHPIPAFVAAMKSLKGEPND